MLLRTGASVVALLLSGALLFGCYKPERSATPKKQVKVTPLEREFYDVAYGTDSARQDLDVYLPPNGDGPFPVIVFVHGGGFVTGDKRDGQQKAILQALERGYAVVSINYRLLGDASFPAQVQDVKSAIRWVRANREAYAFDPTRVAVWGNSAGGHLAALAGTSSGERSLEPSTPMPAGSDRVQAIVDWFGPVDLGDMYEHLKTQPRSWETTTQMKYLKRYMYQQPSLVRVANPITHITRDDPPIRIEHGTADETIPPEQAMALADRMRLVIGPNKVQLRMVPGAGHGGQAFTNPHNVSDVLDFLDQAMGVQRPPQARAAPSKPPERAVP